MNDDIYCQDKCVNITYKKTLQYSPLFRTSHIIYKPNSRLSLISARELRVYLQLGHNHFFEFVRHDCKSEKSDY